MGSQPARRSALDVIRCTKGDRSVQVQENQKGSHPVWGARIRQALHRVGFSRPRNADRRGMCHSRHFATGRPVAILDLACGIGTHAIYWAEHGHHVTAIDISETFISEARQAACRSGVPVDLRVAGIKMLEFVEQFDVVTWIEKPHFNDDMPAAIYRFLVPGGYFIGDVRNPEHPKVKRLAQGYRTWREEGGIFYLECHESNAKADVHEDVWIKIDPGREVIEEEFMTSDVRSGISHNLQAALDELPKVGFKDIELRTAEGEVFKGGEEPYWLWIVARR
jgi:SAM-dependent methyltransferase